MLEEGADDFALQIQMTNGKSAEEKKKAQEDWKKQSAANKKLKFTYKEQKEYETIEADIAGLEEKITKIDGDIVKNARDFGKLNELTKQKEDLEQQLEEKMERWVYLEELAEKIKTGQ